MTLLCSPLVVAAELEETNTVDAVAEVTAQPPEDSAAAPMPVERAPTFPAVIRGVEMNPDVLFDPDAQVMEDNIAAFVARAAEMNVNTVYAHGMAEPEADGSYADPYFDTIVAPMRADILKPLAEQLHANDIGLHVIMPVLSVALQETDSSRAMMVMSMGINKVRPSQSWRKRLSPFSTNGLALMIQLYEDLATEVPLDGVVFGDDAYLTDSEDLNPAALERYGEELGIEDFTLGSLDSDQKAAIVDLNVRQLDSWCGSLMDAVKALRPGTLFSRTLYAPTIHHPPSRAWLAQDYGEALRAYDMIYALADAEMEDLNWSTSWLLNLAEQASERLSGTAKIVFRLPTYSRKRERWHSERALAKTVERMTSAGAVHFALGPDDVVVDRPRLRKAKRVFQGAP